MASTTAVTPELEAAAERAQARRGFLVSLPAYGYLVVFFAIPLVIVFVVSVFGRRNPRGATVYGAPSLEAYRKIFEAGPDGSHLVLEIVWRSLWLSVVTTVVCLLLAYPLAYYIATRSARVRNVLLVLVMIPFWSNFLVRTYAWRVLLGRSGPVTAVTSALGLTDTPMIFTVNAVLVGLVYGFLPFMVLPLYAAIERMDWSLVEAARDLYASGWQAFRKVTWPLSRPGVIAGSILVFIPAFGAYVTPEILGGSKTTLLGSYIVRQFLQARDAPFGSALSFVLMSVMLGATVVYFRTGGRNL